MKRILSVLLAAALLAGLLVTGAFASETDLTCSHTNTYSEKQLSGPEAGWLYIYCDDCGELLEKIAPEIPMETEPPSVKITKSPTGETVTEGGSCLFIAKAENYSSLSWMFVNPSGTDYTSSEVKSVLPGLGISGEGTTSLSLYNIPKAMDGWTVYCSFYGAASFANTSTAKVTVTTAPTATPKPTATPAPTATPEPEETKAPENTEKPEDHKHSFGKDWEFDDDTHWQECECGEKTDPEPHEVTLWATADDGSKLGVCKVCGAPVRQEAEPDIREKGDGKGTGTDETEPAGTGRKSSVGTVLVIAAIVVAAVAAIGAAVFFLLIRPKMGGAADPKGYNPRHDGLHDDEDRAEYYREQLEEYERNHRD